MLVFKGSAQKKGGRTVLTTRTRQLRVILVGLVVVVSATLLASVTQAQQTIDITDSFFATYKTLIDTKDLGILSSEVWGIVSSNNENKAFENMTSYCLAVRKFVAGKQRRSLTYTKFMDKDGDFIVVETIRDETETGPEGTWTFIQGTGKWKGIKGGGKAWFSARGKPQTPSTAQGRVRMKGSYEVPK
jgi:hypothetical protein